MRAVLREMRELTADVRHFVFEIDAVERFDFTPGQFVSLHGQVGGKQITRAYSLAAPPRANRIELCLNRVEGGVFSPHLFTLEPGNAVDITGPLGFFVPRPVVRTSVLVATGTGIAPFRAMLPALLEASPGHAFTLLFGTRREGSILYREEWENWKKRYGNFRFWPTLSRPGEEWAGRRGYVQASLAEALGGSVEADIFVCGLKAMVDEVRALAKSLGLDRKQIIYEKYD